jgi:hypothetical protein
MTKSERSPNDEVQNLRQEGAGFMVIGISDFFRHSSFVIRHSERA